MTDAGEQRSELGRDPNLVGLLSLQLLLLAFFILLVSISSFDNRRVRSVLDSVDAVFSGAATSAESGAETHRADAIVLDSIVTEVEGVLATALQFDRMERIGDGAVQFDLPAAALFATGTAQLAPGRADLLKHIVAALDRRPAGYRYDIEALVGRSAPTADAAGAQALSPPMLEIDRAGMLARTLQEVGAMPAGIAAGFLPDAPNGLRLIIRLSDQPRPRDLFADKRPVEMGTGR